MISDLLFQCCYNALNTFNATKIASRGLGKTIQIISLIAHLRQNDTSGPYLIAGR